MRALNSLTQNLIDNLTQILQNPEEDALQTLKICAPVLIEELQQIQLRAVDRRDIVPQIKQLLDEWLQQHPQPDTAQQALIEAVDRAEILQGGKRETVEERLGSETISRSALPWAGCCWSCWLHPP